MKQEIQSVAIRLFSEHGYGSVTLPMIAKVCGCKPSDVYKHFRTKGDIVHTLRAEGFKRLSDSLQECAFGNDPQERLIRFGRIYLQFALSEPDLFILMFNLGGRLSRAEVASGSMPEASFPLFRQIVREVMVTGLFGETDFETVLLGLWSVAHGMACLLIGERYKEVHGEGQCRLAH